MAEPKEKMENQLRLARVELLQNRRNFHHNALWEEEKHFTWWVYILLSALALIYTSDLCDQAKLPIIAAGAILGIIICSIALAIMRRESIYFKDSLHHFTSEFDQYFEVCHLTSRWKWSVRDYFKLIFWIFIAVFGLIFLAVLILILQFIIPLLVKY